MARSGGSVHTRGQRLPRRARRAAAPPRQGRAGFKYRAARFPSPSIFLLYGSGHGDGARGDARRAPLRVVVGVRGHGRPARPCKGGSSVRRRGLSSPSPAGIHLSFRSSASESSYREIGD
jgi:hypothetical protein